MGLQWTAHRCGASAASQLPENNMKRFALIAAAALMLCGCQTIQSAIGSTASTDALQASKAAIATYADVYQPAVIAYGRLPTCPAALLCKDTNVFRNLEVANLAVIKSIVAAQAMLEGTATDSGQIAAAFQAVAQVEASIAAAFRSMQDNGQPFLHASRKDQYHRLRTPTRGSPHQDQSATRQPCHSGTGKVIRMLAVIARFRSGCCRKVASRFFSIHQQSEGVSGVFPCMIRPDCL
jgi:hypothetical protein